MKDYSISDKIQYYSKMSKKGSVDINGKPLNDFQRGVNYGRAEMLGRYASKIKKKGKKEVKNYSYNLNSRTYTDSELNTLFDNLKSVEID